MSHLCKKLPSVEDLAELDSFDLAFLVLTGYVRMVPLLEEVFNVLKRDASVYLWGPYSKMAEKVLAKTWKEQGGEKFTKEIVRSFDMRGNISVDRERIKKVFDKYADVGEKTWFSARPLIIPILLDTATGARELFEERRKKALKTEKSVKLTEELFSAWVAEATSNHIGAFVKSYPGRILHPEVQRLVEIVEQSPERRLIDKAVLKGRIEYIATAMPRSYFENVSDVHVGRVWTLTGLIQASMYQVVEYQIVAERDRRTCPVCQRMDGRHFSVKKAIDRYMDYMEIGNGKDPDPSEAMRLFPFPREKDLDNKSPEEIRNFGYSPPLHPRCRCDVAMLWKREVTSRDESRIPRIRTGREALDLVPAEVPRGGVEKTVESMAEEISAFTKDGEFVDADDARRAKAMVAKNLSTRMQKLKSKSWENYVKRTYGKEVLDVADHDLACSDLVAQWAATSGDDSRLALALQLAAKEEFGLKGASVWWNESAVEAAELFYAEHGEALRLFLREMYNETQEYLGKRGIKKLRLFRGMILEEKEAGNLTLASEGTNFVKTTDIRMQPMSSFSADPTTAVAFAEPNEYHPVAVTMFVEIPAERVLSCPMTGFGCLREYEAVVLATTETWYADNVAYIMTNLAAEMAKSPAEVAKLFAARNPEFFSKWTELVESKLLEVPYNLFRDLRSEVIVGKILPLIQGASKLE